MPALTAGTDVSHEARIIDLFVRKEKRERLRVLGASASRRADFIDALLHDTRSLDRPRLVALASTADAASVSKRLRAKPRSLAHCISALVACDGLELPLEDALRACMGRDQDSVVFCIDSGLAYYENHEGERFLLV